MEKGLSKVVCVTGAGGYVASWLVKRLLSLDFTVHGTVRNPSDAKYDHLKKLENAADNLKLFKADLLDYDSISAAVKGCVGVFHVACPVPSSSVPNPQVEIMEPAVTGTLNVLKACSEAKIKRTVFVSSIAAVLMNPNWPADQVMDEDCWSDKDICIRTNNWYHAAKTEAEMEAFEYAKSNGLDVVSVCPSLVLGPIMQSTVNASTLVLIKLLKDGRESIENKMMKFVDVRDVVAALLLVFEKSEAEGRYICSSHHVRMREIVDKLPHLYPGYKYPKNFTVVDDGTKISSEKLQRLGWTFRPLEETLRDSVESYKKLGLLD